CHTEAWRPISPVAPNGHGPKATAQHLRAERPAVFINRESELRMEHTTPPFKHMACLRATCSV
ncbi:MAG: hypothetical protein R3183_10020, partial [Oleiphilaceae bacterium]|nr:hypothetical protein [Oleiphilaceae bacterium]